MKNSSTIKIERVKVSDLNLDMQNLRGHKEPEIELLVRSLTIFGQYKPLIVDKATMTVKIGNGRLMAMRKMGWTECDCVLVDWSDKQGMEVMDNRLNELSSWIDSGLGKWFKDKGTDWWGVDDEISGKLERLAEKAEKDEQKKKGKAEDNPPEPEPEKQVPLCPCCGKPLVKKKRIMID